MFNDFKKLTHFTPFFGTWNGVVDIMSRSCDKVCECGEL